MMRRVRWFCVVWVCLPSFAAAQDYPKAEIFTGYSYLRGTDLNANFNGFGVSAAVSANRWFGVTSDFSAHFHNPYGPNVHSLLFGPKFTYRQQSHFNPYFQVLVGATWGITWEPNRVFTWGAGGGFDVKVHKRVSIRILDITYLMLRQHYTNSSNGRLSTGLVWHLGGGE